MVFVELPVENYFVNTIQAYTDFILTPTSTGVAVLTLYSGSYPDYTSTDASISHSLWGGFNQLLYGSSSIELIKSEIDRTAWYGQSQVRLVSLSQDVYGECIKPGSLQIVNASSSITINDDANGNLYDASVPSSVIGNVFYKLGVFTLCASSPSDYRLVMDAYWTLALQSTVTVYEKNWIANLPNGALNASQNPSILSGSAGPSGSAIEYWLYGTGSLSRPAYVTTIGLYNDNNELLVTGRIGAAIDRNLFRDLAFRLRIDD